MAKLWGLINQPQDKPIWLLEEQKQRSFADKSGWCISRKDGTIETLVAVRIKNIYKGRVIAMTFSSGATYSPDETRSIYVTFSEPVAITGSPTLKVIASDLINNITATFTSLNVTNTIATFDFTVPAAGNVLSIPPQTIALPVDATDTELDDPNMPVDLSITGLVSSAAGTKLVSGNGQQD